MSELDRSIWCRGCLDAGFGPWGLVSGVLLCEECSDYVEACRKWKRHHSCLHVRCTECSRITRAASVVNAKCHARGVSRTLTLARLHALFAHASEPPASLPRSLGG